MTSLPDPAFVVLRSASLTAWILPRGATLAGLWLKGHAHSLVLGFARPADFTRTQIYAGALVGPVANRIGGARLTIAGRAHAMAANEGTTCLHSGPEGLHGHDWTVTAQSDAHVTLATTLPDGACGLPGNRRISARYTLAEPGTLDLLITATSDADTVMNIAHHPYWTLDGAPTVAGQRLQVAADSVLPVDALNLPTGEIAPVASGAYDFRSPAAVPVDRTLDANLCLARAPRPQPVPVATLTGVGGITLGIKTTEPGLQVYNGAGLPMGGPPTHGAPALAPFAGIALEPQGWPDAPHHPHFPGIGLNAGASYRQHTRYDFRDSAKPS